METAAWLPPGHLAALSENSVSPWEMTTSSLLTGSATGPSGCGDTPVSHPESTEARQKSDRSAIALYHFQGFPSTRFLKGSASTRPGCLECLCRREPILRHRSDPHHCDYQVFLASVDRCVVAGKSSLSRCFLRNTSFVEAHALVVSFWVVGLGSPEQDSLKGSGWGNGPARRKAPVCPHPIGDIDSSLALANRKPRPTGKRVAPLVTH